MKYPDFVTHRCTMTEWESMYVWEQERAKEGEIECVCMWERDTRR